MRRASCLLLSSEYVPLRGEPLADKTKSPAKDKPRYTRGHAVTLSMVALGTIIYGFLWWWYKRVNEQRQAGVMKEKHRNMREDELAELGDESPRYRYTI